MSAYLPRSLQPMLDEQAAIDATFSDADALRSLGERPLVVLTAAAPMQAADLAALKLTSEQGQRLQAVWFERPDAVIDAVREVVNDLRGQS